MADIQYLNYGDLQIELLALLNNLANEVQGYVQNLPWSNKRKEKFMSAYSDLMKRGILGASNNTGQWIVNVNGDPLPFDSMNKKDKEMYLEAAYFIQLLMANLPTKAKEEEQKKQDLPVFSNSQFTKDLGIEISNLFGGMNVSTKNDWDPLDERDSNGLRGITNRANKLALSLLNYYDSLKDDEYNFEGSPFKNINDFKTKLNTAIQTLQTDPEHSLDALAAIGLRYSDYFNNGSNDIVGVDNDGNQITYGQLALANLAIADERTALETNEFALEQTDEAAKLLLLANANLGINSILSGIHGTDAKTNPLRYAEYIATKVGTGQQGFTEMNNLVQSLLEKGYSGGGLNSEEKKRLGNLLYYIREKNPNYQGLGGGEKTNVTLEEYEELKKHKNFGNTGIKNVIRLPWQTHDGRYTYADDKGNVFYLKPSNLKKFAAPIINRSKEYYNYKNNFLKTQNNLALNTTIKNNNGLTDDMKADLAAMGLDLVSAGAAFAPGYGTLASAVTGMGATISGAIADRMRGESWGSTLGTAGFGLSMDILGLIPGAGVGAKAAKIAKVVSKGAKWLGPALGGLAAMSYGPGALSAYKKFTSGKKDNITAEELRDFTYAIRAIAAGGIRKTGATYLGNRTLAKAIKEGRAEIRSTKQAASVTTKNGQQIKLTDEEFKTLKSNVSRETKAKTITLAAQREKINLLGDEIEWKGLNPVKGRFKTSSKSSKLSGLQEGTESNKIKWSSTSADYKGIRRFSNENLLRKFTTMSSSNSGIWKSLRDRWTGQDVLNSPKTSPLKESIKLELKALPLLPGKKKSYSLPETLSNIIHPSRRLPQPGGEHTGNIVDIQRTGNLSTNKKFSVRLNQQELNNAWDTYGVSPKRPSSSIKGGYGKETEINPGTYTTKINILGNKSIPVIFDKDLFGGIKITVGDNSKSFTKITEARLYMAKQLFNLSKKVNHNEIANLLRAYKKQGILKQGGTIDKQRVQKYKEFIK